MDALEVLVNVMVLVYIHNIIRNYFRDRVVFAQTASGIVRKEMTCGVPEESVLGPLLWNIAFDDILKEEVPPGVSIIYNADDTLVVMAEDNISMLERKVNTETLLEGFFHIIGIFGSIETQSESFPALVHHNISNISIFGAP